MSLAIKEQLISEIQELTNPTVVVQLFELWQILKRTSSATVPVSSILSYAGCLDDKEAEEMRQLIQSEFTSLPRSAW